MITQIKTWWEWNIIHDSYSDRFEARKTVEGKEVMKHSNSLLNLEKACDAFDMREEWKEKMKPVSAYKYAYNSQRFLYGKITSIVEPDWDSWRGLSVRWTPAGEKSWSLENLYSDTFILQTPENEEKIAKHKEITEKIEALQEEARELRKSMQYFTYSK